MELINVREIYDEIGNTKYQTDKLVFLTCNLAEACEEDRTLVIDMITEYLKDLGMRLENVQKTLIERGIK